MAKAQSVIIKMYILVSRSSELDRRLEIGKRRLWLAPCIQCKAQLEHPAGIIVVERDCLFKLDFRFGEAVLKPTKHPLAQRSLGRFRSRSSASVSNCSARSISC